MNHPGQLTVPFDPVFSVRGAPVRPILMEKVANKPVKRDILRATYTVNAGVVFCCIISSNDLVMQENAVQLSMIYLFLFFFFTINNILNFNYSIIFISYYLISGVGIVDADLPITK
jgi:hypothetical protein